MDAPIDALPAWADYGLPGLIIGTLIGVIVWMIKFFHREREDLRQERQAISQFHRDERKEWKAEAEKRDDRVFIVVNELKEVIRAQKRKSDA